MSSEGSYWPSLLLLLLCLSLYLSFGSSPSARAARRSLAMTKIGLRRRLGLRDESKYKMSAGDGANAKLKRQG
ncbi:hypothetical protein TeGR_g6863 [Tetraparma gracilis]|uniref:Uncharacterized protein n=1 Tax=Tetraparma gracilis TaxID=2962635 RepID=A0ABQ6N1Y9_9STRA|nr:hypothetical protein TeGR_g6863 [Tetraparma gracilis]